MTNERYTEEFQKALNDYIKLGFNQDECNGFMHGFHKGAEAQQLILPIVSNQRELLKCDQVCDWYSVGHQLNGHQECRTCGKQKAF